MKKMLQTYKCIVVAIILSIVLSCNSVSKKDSSNQQYSEVIQKAPSYIEIERADSDTIKRLYLTFDDGPYTTTPRLVELLKQQGVRASFFIVGSQVAYSHFYDSIFKHMLAYDSFKVYNHTYSHAVTNGRIRKYYQNPILVCADIDSNRKILPTNSFITRLPGKNAWRSQHRTTKDDKDIQMLFAYMDSTNNKEEIIGWDVEWSSNTNKSWDAVEKLIYTIEKKFERAGAANKDVVLLSHDYLHKSNADLALLEKFIEHFKRKKDVKFDWVHNLPQIGVMQKNATSVKNK